MNRKGGVMKRKEEMLRCRMSSEMKARVETEAKRRGESASVIVREALREWLEKRNPSTGHV